MSGYSIFEHAQFGHDSPASTVHKQWSAPPTSRTLPVPDTQELKPRNRRGSAKGWAVEAGLGLGPAFNKSRR